MKLLIARHCRTAWNARRKVQGSTDIPLDGVGREQAAALAEKLAHEGVTRIVCSDLARSVETGRIIGARLGVPVDEDSRLRECSFGLAEGMGFRLFAFLFGQMHGKSPEKRLRYDFRLVGGEYAPFVAIRHMRAVFDAIRTGPPDATILLIGHGRGLRTLFAALGIERSAPHHGEYLVLHV